MTKRIRRTTGRTECITMAVFLAVLTPLVTPAQTNDSTAAEVAAAVLPLPVSLRAGATVVVHRGTDQYTVLRKGSNEMVCIREPIQGDGNAYAHGKTFWAHCYHEMIFVAMKRAAEVREELVKAGKAADPKLVNDAIDSEIKAGKLKLPDHPTMGFQMRGPLNGYNPAKNSVSPDIRAWQMVIIPYSTGLSLSLPETNTDGMPWVMSSGAWNSHIMIGPAQTPAMQMH